MLIENPLSLLLNKKSIFFSSSLRDPFFYKLQGEKLTTDYAHDPTRIIKKKCKVIRSYTPRIVNLVEKEEIKTCINVPESVQHTVVCASLLNLSSTLPYTSILYAPSQPVVYIWYMICPYYTKEKQRHRRTIVIINNTNIKFF